VAIVVAVVAVVAAVEVVAAVASVTAAPASAAWAIETGTRTTARHPSAPARTRREDQALRIHTVPNSGKNNLQLRHTIAGR
jgi:acetaldehyde dehydrogenase (acetylating)